MRIFLYEHLTGGGTLDGQLGGIPSGSLLAEGTAMVTALAADLAALPETYVDLLRDARLTDPRLMQLPARIVHDVDDQREQFCELAAAADAVMVIAPETGGILLQRCRWAQASGAGMLSPSSAFIEMAADKHRTAAVLQAAGIPVPQGRLIDPGTGLPPEFAYPAVLKPRFGAGSMDTRYLADWRAASRYGRAADAMRLERFHAGRPASVSVLCGPRQRFALPACWQTISDDGRFSYLGGIVPVDKAFCQRAHTLARHVLNALPATIGYIGVDMILGPDPSGCGDVVLEVNPRVTTSYVGLRRLCRGNLAAMMVAVARGETIDWVWSEEAVTFTCDGQVWTARDGEATPAGGGGSGDADGMAGGRYRRRESQVG